MLFLQDVEIESICTQWHTYVAKEWHMQMWGVKQSITISFNALPAWTEEDTASLNPCWWHSTDLEPLQQDFESSHLHSESPAKSEKISKFENMC